MRSSLRAPFVVTLAVGALGTACTSADDAADHAADATFDSDVDTTADASADASIDATDASDASFDVDPDAPNAPQCPKDDPGFGPKVNPCSAPPTIVCTYPDRCDQRPADAGPPINAYVCKDPGTGPRWVLVHDYAPGCPAIAPNVGDPCPCSPHMLYSACLYGSCEKLDRSYFDCQSVISFETTWKSTPVSCNPPEPDGGFDADASADATDGD